MKVFRYYSKKIFDASERSVQITKLVSYVLTIAAFVSDCVTLEMSLHCVHKKKTKLENF